jgi:hypothetical protein
VPYVTCSDDIGRGDAVGCYIREDVGRVGRRRRGKGLLNGMRRGRTYSAVKREFGSGVAGVSLWRSPRD